MQLVSMFNWIFSIYDHKGNVPKEIGTGKEKLYLF